MNEQQGKGKIENNELNNSLSNMTISSDKVLASTENEKK